MIVVDNVATAISAEELMRRYLNFELKLNAKRFLNESEYIFNSMWTTHNALCTVHWIPPP